PPARFRAPAADLLPPPARAGARRETPAASRLHAVARRTSRPLQPRRVARRAPGLEGEVARHPAQPRTLPAPQPPLRAPRPQYRALPCLLPGQPLPRIAPRPRPTGSPDE